LWPASLSSIHKCFCYDWKILLGVINYWFIWSTFKFLFVVASFSTCSCTMT
jgi:hypothetical protein